MRRSRCARGRARARARRSGTARFSSAPPGVRIRSNTPGRASRRACWTCIKQFSGTSPSAYDRRAGRRRRRPRRRGRTAPSIATVFSSAGRSRGCRAREQDAVALTFDDGPNPGRHAAHPRRAQGSRRSRDVLHSRPARRAVAGAREARGGRRTSDRQSRLLPPKAALQVARPTCADDLDARHRGDRARVGRASAVLSRAARLSQPVGDAHRAVAGPANRRLVARRLGLGPARAST